MIMKVVMIPNHDSCADHNRDADNSGDGDKWCLGRWQIIMISPLTDNSNDDMIIWACCMVPKLFQASGFQVDS